MIISTLHRPLLPLLYRRAACLDSLGSSPWAHSPFSTLLRSQQYGTERQVDPAASEGPKAEGNAEQSLQTSDPKPVTSHHDPKSHNGHDIHETSKKSIDKDSPDLPGAMSRRLEQATEEAVLTGGRAGQTAVAEAGFSEELKARLLERVRDADFRTQHARALREVGTDGKIGSGTRAQASAPAWQGEEEQADAVLRMLDDGKKKLSVDMGRANVRFTPARSMRPGERLATARDKSSLYTSLKNVSMSDEERAVMREGLRARFEPAARAMPSDLRGLTALANERIEDAMARGQFKVSLDDATLQLAADEV